MNEVEKVLHAYGSSALSLPEAAAQLHRAYIADIGHTALDLHRARRVGAPEVVFGLGKSARQMADIFETLAEKKQDVLATRVGPEQAEAIRTRVRGVMFNEAAGTATLSFQTRPRRSRPIAVVTAGTSDSRVAEEAAVTAEFYGNTVMRFSDVGVAGIHRLFACLDELNQARVAIVIAGMEGALPSVVAGLVKMPVIAVPTSVGYGANLGGITALLGMVNSCASGVSVVNIDNGFGAGYQASLINTD
ncbi:nickel pincer cofactor biosynthesis protein LarB [Burkholderia sp. Bp9142]|uniref:nickel pincer cofactor biosynthesis protein LarB n=1 Tax=Burkholderia sp. Bp9142 TaxID=2184573 RepID=UPI000F5A26BF|nr:nickel pincer cofactor biosynthesis protein LarB [Burkholderia sp. Bp9142]RQR30152.1 nickel pincer cofactor biosynthesis protein LarB [Burkholderia sp. Bp9142]